MRLSGLMASAAVVCCLAPLAGAATDPLHISEIIKPPVNLAISGRYYSKPEKSFSMEVSQDRFVKRYSDGITIIGVRRKETSIYYIIDDNRKTVVKVSQGNLYRLGRFFTWTAMTTLVDLPGDTAVTAEGDVNKGKCIPYRTAKDGVALCVDSANHLPLVLEQKGVVVARVISVQPLRSDLEADTDSLMRACRRQQYDFLDVDADMEPDAD